ncbi:MAG: BrnT family toxin [Candidatus Rokubacteria bacterium]|nr:BrnT family toxin [Candidatus Rokubacteria bacterium]
MSVESVEWDEAKRQRNVRIHGVDFPRAGRVFEGARFEGPDPRRRPGEPRWLALGSVDGLDLLVVFTWRGTTRRIISAWRVGRESKTRYSKVLARRPPASAGPDAG